MTAIISLLSLVALSGCDVRQQGRQTTAPASPPARIATLGRSFHLVGPAGRTVTDRDFRGKFMLIYFGYTTCPNHCSTMLAIMAGALDELGPTDQVQAIFITVDPERDTPDIMGRYTDNFSQRILGLSGSVGQIESVERIFGVQTAMRRTGPEPGAYVIDHPAVFYLVGPDGEFISEIDAHSGDALAARVQPLLGISPPADPSPIK